MLVFSGENDCIKFFICVVDEEYFVFLNLIDECGLFDVL